MENYSILGLYRDNGKEDGNYYSILGLYRDNGKENGNYYSGFRFGYCPQPMTAYIRGHIQGFILLYHED